MNPKGDGTAWGVLILNSNAMDYTVTPGGNVAIATTGGILDLYFFVGSTPTQVVQQYQKLVGLPFMPPIWALGYQVWMSDYTSLNEVKGAVTALDQAGVPKDVIWLDVFQDSKAFTLNSAFGGLQAYIRQLASVGIQIGLVTNPAIPADNVTRYSPYTTGLEEDVFVKIGSGTSGSDPNAVLYAKRLNEPAEFSGSASCERNDVACQACPQNRWEYPPYTPVAYRNEEGNATQLHNGTLCMNAAFGERLRYKHYDVHSIYGWSHSMATQWALTDLIGDRTLVISESTYPSTGRYAGHLVQLPDFGEWSGLRRAIVAVLEFNIFGIPYGQPQRRNGRETAVLRDATTHSYYLPPDVWFDFASGLRKDGSTEMMSRSITENSTLLVHVRGGQVLPVQPALKNTMDRTKVPYDLYVYPKDGFATGELFVDDGISHGTVDSNQYDLFSFILAQNLLRVSISHFGNGTRQNATVRNIVFFDVDVPPTRVTMNKNSLSQNSVLHDPTKKLLPSGRIFERTTEQLKEWWLPIYVGQTRGSWLEQRGDGQLGQATLLSRRDRQDTFAIAHIQEIFVAFVNLKQNTVRRLFVDGLIMERREPSVARSSRPPVYPRCGQSQGLVPAASSRMGSPKPSASPPAPSRRMVTRRHSEDDETAFPTALPPIDVSERIALVPAPRRPLRVAALATSRRQPLPKPRERRESACGLQQPSVATGSPKKCAVPRQRPEGWFRKDMGDSMYVAVPARDAVEVDKSTAALLKGAIAEDRHGSPATGEAEEALPNAAAAAPVPASRAPGRPQVTAERRGTRPVPRSGVQVYVELRKPDKEKRGDKRVGLRTGFPRSQSPINEDPETPARHSGAISEVSLTVDTGIQHQRRTSLLKNISTSISAALGRFFHKGAGAEQVQPAPRSGQATRTEWNDDIEAALNVGLVANDETKTTGQRGESNVRSRYYRDRCEGLAASGISLTQIVSVTRRTEARKPLAPRHMDKQQQPPRRGKAEPEQSHAKLLEVAELSAKPSYHADKQHTLKEAKAEPMESYSDLPEVKELPPELPYHSDEGGERDGRKTKRKKSAASSELTEQAIEEGNDKSEMGSRGKSKRKSSTVQGPGRKASLKKEEITELTSGAPGASGALEGGRKRSDKRDRKESTPGGDVTEKNVADETEQSSLRTTGMSRRKSSALDKREKEPSGKVSEKKGDVEEAGKSEANGNDRERRISRTGKAIERKHDAEEAGSPDSKVVVPSKLPGDRKKSSPERDTAEDGASQERPVVKKRRPSQAGLLNGTEEAGARNIALLSPPTMPDKETRAEKRRSSCQARLPVVVEGQRDDKKDSAESSASEGKRKKRRRSKGERSAESDVTGEKREDSAIVQDVGRTTGSKTSLGGRRASTKKRPSKSKRKQSGAFKSRDESSRDAEKQLAATKEMEQPLASGQDVAQTLVVREEAALVALPVDGALLPLKSNERSTAADKEADAVVRERQVQSPATAEATAAEPGTAPPSLQPGAVSQERRRSTQGGQVGADKDLELEGLDGSLQGGPSKVPAPEADDGEPSRRCKLSSEKETKDANDNGKTGPLVPSQESGPPGGGKQDDVHLPVTVTEDKDNRLKEKGRDDVAGDGKSRKAESEGKDRKGKQGKVKGKSEGHINKQKHKHGQTHHRHEHKRDMKRSRKESDEASTRCVETQTCLAAPAVEKGGPSCRDFNFGVNLIPITRSTLASNERRQSGRRRSPDARQSSKDLPEVTKTLSDAPEPKSAPAVKNGSGARSKRRKSKRHSEGSKTGRKERRKQTPATVESKRSGTALSDVKLEAIPEGDKKLMSKQKGSDLCECLPLFFDHKTRMPEPPSKPVMDVLRTQLGSDQGKKDVDRSPEEGVGDQSRDRKKSKRASSKGRKTKRSKHGRKKVGKMGAQRELPEAGESVPFRFQWRPRETIRPLSWSTVGLGTEMPWLPSPAEEPPSPKNLMSTKDVLQAFSSSSTVIPLVGVTGEPPSLRNVSEKPKEQRPDDIDDGDKDAGTGESPSRPTAKGTRGRSKGSRERSKGGRRSKKGDRKPSKHGGKDTEASPQREGRKRQSKRKTGSRGKRSSSKRKRDKKRPPDDADPSKLLAHTGPESQASPTERPTAKEKAGEKSAPIEVKGGQGSHEFDFDITRRLVTKGTYEQQESVPAEEQQATATASWKGPVPASQKRDKRRKKRVSRKNRRSGSAKKGKADRERQRTDGGASSTNAPVGRTSRGYGSPAAADRASPKERLPFEGRPEGKKLSAADLNDEGQRDFNFVMSRRPVISGKYGGREPKRETGQPESKIAISKSLKGGKRAGDKKDEPHKLHKSRKSHGRRSEKPRDDSGDIARSPSSSPAQASLTSTEEKADNVHAADNESARGMGRRDFDFVIGSHPVTRGTFLRPDLTQVSEPAKFEAFECRQGAFVRDIRTHDEVATRADSGSPPSGDWEGSGKDRERKRQRRHRTRFDSRRSKSRSGGGARRGRTKSGSRSRKSSSRGKKRDKRRRRHRKDSRRRRQRRDRGGRRRRGKSRSGRRRKRSRRHLAVGYASTRKAPTFFCGMLILIAFVVVIALCVGLLYYYMLAIKPRHTTPETTAYSVIIDKFPESTVATRWTDGKLPSTVITTASPARPPTPVTPRIGVYYCPTLYCRWQAVEIDRILARETNPCDNFYQHVCARWKQDYLEVVPRNVSLVSQGTLLMDRLLTRFINDIYNASQGDFQVAAKLYVACADRREKVHTTNRTMKAVFEGWTIQEWPRTAPVPGGASAVWRFAAELVRDLGLATIVGASVGVNPDDLNTTLVELYRPRLLLPEAKIDDGIVQGVVTTLVERLTSLHRGGSTPGLNESLLKVHSALASFVHPPHDDIAGDDIVVRQVGQLGQGLRQFLQVLLADVRSQVSRAEKVLLRSPLYLLGLEEKLNAVPPLDALNYMGFLVYIRVLPFVMEFVSKGPNVVQLCRRLVEETLPDCFAKVSKQWRTSTNQDVAAREWLFQLEGVFLRHVADLIWMSELSSLLVRYRLKTRVFTQFGQLAGEQRQCAPTGNLNPENPILFFMNIKKRQQEQVFEGLLVNSSTLRRRLAATHSDLSDVVRFERAFRTIHVPAALFDFTMPTNSSVFVFQLARVAVRLFHGLMQLLDENPYEHETPFVLTDESRRRRGDLVACFTRDGQKSLPARFRGPGVAEGQLGEVFLERTTALLLAAKAFDELLSLRRIWQLDLRLKGLSRLSGDQLFFIYFALDNCVLADEKLHWNRLPAEQLVNVPLRHTRKFAEAFGCRAGRDRMVASPGGELCEVFRRHPSERRVWEARRSRSWPVNGTPAAEDA
ncbi:hypothetical protein HPB49_024641 [Dermacentor silvarum]|uniref:Uncharacterized protein n=1 Tax=Dermacentor silvarum TaxID=543639 RepID=A0ACB8DLM9_DERSI|nr:hypothetical protein HPB49_024641 [Dermacentor silvarum]